MSRKRSILEELTIDELRAKFDDYELEVDDRRVRAQLIDALARSRKVRIADILYQMSRDRLKQLCRAIGLGDTGRGKAELVGRLTGSAGAPEEPPRPSTKPPTESPSLEAALLLKNLLARLDADALGERPLFRSVVSDAEREALRALLGSAGSPPLSPSTEPTKPIERVETPLPAVELNTDALRLDASPEPAWVLCLDFGTAKSKAFAATGDEEEPGLEPLAVGQADNDLDGSVHEVSSCVWIDDDGQLFVGSEAVNRGMSYGGRAGDATATRFPQTGNQPSGSGGGRRRTCSEAPAGCGSHLDVNLRRCDHDLLGVSYGLGDDGARITLGDAVRSTEIHGAVLAADATPLGRRSNRQESATRAVAGGYVSRPLGGGHSR